MLKEEFDKLTGVVSEDQEYSLANEAYMAAGNVDKEVFCSEYVKAKCTINALVSEFSNLKIENLNLRKKLYDKEIENREMYSQRRYLGRMLMREADEYDVDSEKRKAILEDLCAIFNEREIILFKLKLGVKLTSSEFEYVKISVEKE